MPPKIPKRKSIAKGVAKHTIGGVGKLGIGTAKFALGVGLPFLGTALGNLIEKSGDPVSQTALKAVRGAGSLSGRTGQLALSGLSGARGLFSQTAPDISTEISNISTSDDSTVVSLLKAILLKVSPIPSVDSNINKLLALDLLQYRTEKIQRLEDLETMREGALARGATGAGGLMGGGGLSKAAKIGLAGLAGLAGLGALAASVASDSESSETSGDAPSPNSGDSWLKRTLDSLDTNLIAIEALLSAGLIGSAALKMVKPLVKLAKPIPGINSLLNVIEGYFKSESWKGDREIHGGKFTSMVGALLGGTLSDKFTNTLVQGISGAIAGFLIGNIPGAIVGGIGAAALGSIGGKGVTKYIDDTYAYYSLRDKMNYEIKMNKKVQEELDKEQASIDAKKSEYIRLFSKNYGDTEEYKNIMKEFDQRSYDVENRRQETIERVVKARQALVRQDGGFHDSLYNLTYGIPSTIISDVSTGFTNMFSSGSPDLSNLDPITKAMIQQESGGDPNAVSEAGAKGLMQIMPFHYERLAKLIGVKKFDPFNPEHSIKGGSIILNEEMRRFNNNLPLALAAYNAGAPAVLRAQKKAGATDFASIRRFLPSETRDYVPSVLGILKNQQSVQTPKPVPAPAPDSVDPRLYLGDLNAPKIRSDDMRMSYGAPSTVVANSGNTTNNIVQSTGSSTAMPSNTPISTSTRTGSSLGL